MLQVKGISWRPIDEHRVKECEIIGHMTILVYPNADDSGGWAEARPPFGPILCHPTNRLSPGYLPDRTSKRLDFSCENSLYQKFCNGFTGLPPEQTGLPEGLFRGSAVASSPHDNRITHGNDHD